MVVEHDLNDTSKNMLIGLVLWSAQYISADGELLQIVKWYV